MNPILSICGRSIYQSIFVSLVAFCCIFSGIATFVKAEDDIEFSPIVDAAMDENWNKVISIAQKDKSAITDTDNEGVSILHLAAGSANDKVVIKLLKLGADKNVKDINNRRPYDWAMDNNKLSMKVKNMLK